MAENQQESFERRQLFSIRDRQIQKEKHGVVLARKTSARKHLLELQRRKSCDKRATELDPFSLIPEDGWNFPKITEPADLINCMDAFSRFEDMLVASRTKFLFQEVFPFVVDLLSHKDIMTCRHVCKKWCAGVDKLLESVYAPIRIHERSLYTRLEKVELLARFCTHTFTNPSKEPLKTAKFEMRKHAMKSHPRNPFLGRRVSIVVNLDTPEDTASTEPMVKAVFTDFGPHLFHVEYSSRFSHFNPRQYWNLICHIINACTNLKSLWLERIYAGIEDPNFGDDELNFKVDDIPWRPSLESFDISELEEDGLAIQDALISKYSNQLKFLKVVTWRRDMYHNLLFQNLACLHATRDGVMKFLESSMTIELPRLEELSLELDDGHPADFRTLMRAINRFPALATLNITYQVHVSSRFVDYQFLRREHILELMCSKTITCLNLDLSLRNKIPLCFDFLIYFPFLEELTFKITEWGLESPRSCYISAEHGEEYIQLAQYICEEAWNRDDAVTNLYKSNIWQVLTRLQVLKIIRTSSYRIGSWTCNLKLAKRSELNPVEPGKLK